MPFAEFDKKRNGLSEAPGVNELGRYGEPSSTVLTAAEVKPGSTLAIPEIGYGYTVSFTIDGRKEQPGTVLFRSPSATFYLADPVSGLMGYTRDGYLYTFRYSPTPGRKDEIKIEGDNKATRLYVNGTLRDDLSVRTLVFNTGKDKMYYQSTLVFPLGEVGEFESTVTNLNVKNYIEQK